MAYTKVTIATLGPHIKKAEQLKGQIAAAKKAKDKKQLANLEKEFAATAKTITTKANADMKTVIASLKQCETTVEGKLAAASKRVAESRTALNAYKKSKKAADLKVCDGVAADVDELYKAADDDMDALAVSWNEYRTLDIKLDPKIAKEFLSARKAIMDRTVVLRTKVNKAAGLTAEAEAIETASMEVTQGFETSTENRIRHADELYKSVDTTLTTLYAKNDPNRVVAVAQRWREWKGYNFDGDIEDRRRAYKDVTITAQAFNTAQSQLRRTIATKKAVFTAEDLNDDKIVKRLGEVDQRFGKFEDDVKQGLAALKEIAGILKEGEAAVKRRR